MDSSPNIDTKLKRSACDRCHIQKLRCPRSTGKDGSQRPCIRCQKAGTSCTVSAMQKTGRPRKKADTSLRTRELEKDSPTVAGDIIDFSTTSQLNTDCKAHAVPPSATEPRPHTAVRASVERFSPSRASPVNSSGDHLCTSTCDDYTRFLAFDSPPMDVHHMMAEPDFQWVEEAAPGESEDPNDIFTFPAESSAFQARNNNMTIQESSAATDHDSGAAGQDIHLVQADPMNLEGLHGVSSKTTSYSDRSSSTINTRPPSPITFSNGSPELSTATSYNKYDIHEAEKSETAGSPDQQLRHEAGGSMFNCTPPLEANSSLDLKPSSGQNHTQALLQVQFEIYTCSNKFLCLETTSNLSGSTICSSRSENLGRLFSSAEKFISLISRPSTVVSAISSPEASASCFWDTSADMKFTALESTQHSTLWELPCLAQPTSAVNFKNSRSLFDVPRTDLAAFHLVLACHIRLMTAYEAIVDASAAHFHGTGYDTAGVSSVASFSIGSFTVQCGTSLESHLYLQIILHQLQRLSDACYAYLARSSLPNPVENVFCPERVRGLHKRRLRATPDTLMITAKRMVEERELALTAKIKALAHGRHHALDTAALHYAANPF